jgi:hypothetical protein
MAKAERKKPRPLARVAHTAPEARKTPEEMPLPASMAARPLEDKCAAEWAYERLLLYIQNFEERLDASQEVAMGFTGSEAGVLRIEGLGYFAPDLITFYGTDEDGARTQLIQHVSQLNVILRALPRPEDRPEPRRIGFRLAEAGLERR